MPPSGVADTLSAIGNETTYLRFVDHGGHSPEDYAAWLTATLEAALLDRRVIGDAMHGRTTGAGRAAGGLEPARRG